MTMEPEGKLGWKVRLGLIGLGLLLSLAMLEGGLRLAGAALQLGSSVEYQPSEASYLTEIRYRRDQTYEVYAGADGARRRVVVIGDSFANGGNAFSDQTYPYYLHRLFEESGDNVGVVNLGKCEDSTFGVAERLERYLNDAKPEEMPALVAFIVGSADKYNLNSYMPGEELPTVEVDWHDVQPAWYQTFRLYKLYRHIKLGLTSPAMATAYRAKAEATEETFAQFRDFYTRFRDNARAHGWQTEADGAGLPPAFAADNERIKQAFFEVAPTYFSATNIVELRSDEEMLNVIAVGLIVLYASKLRHADAVGFLLEVERDFQLAFWTSEALAYARYNLAQLFQLQSKYTADDLLPQLARSLEAHPRLARVDRFNHLQEMLANGERVDALVDERRLAAWEGIVQLCRAKGVRMLLQNYPSDYRSANAIIKAVSETHGIPLVDVHRLFEGPSKEHGRSRYLADDDHCTPEGYQMMARAVFERIKAEGFLTWMPARAP